MKTGHENRYDELKSIEKRFAPATTISLVSFAVLSIAAILGLLVPFGHSLQAVYMTLWKISIAPAVASFLFLQVIESKVSECMEVVTEYYEADTRRRGWWKW